MTLTPIDRLKLENAVARWDALTADLPPESPAVPFSSLLGDAVDLAAFIEAHYEPAVVRGIARPGLAQVEARSGIRRETAQELRELQAAIAFVQTQLRWRDDSAGKRALENADRLMSEIRAALVFLMRDDESAEGAAMLQSLREESRRKRAHDDVALILEGYAELGARYAEDMESIGVPASLLTEALAEARHLRSRSAERIVRRTTDASDLLLLRNRLIAALQQRLRLSRLAIRYVSPRPLAS